MANYKISTKGANENAHLFQKTLQIAKTLNASCRLCLQKNQQDKQKFTSIFQQKDKNSPSYSTLAMSFAKLNISVTDKYPKVICQQCLETLQRFHDCRKRWELSQMRLTIVMSLGDNITYKKVSNHENRTGEKCPVTDARRTIATKPILAKKAEAPSINFNCNAAVVQKGTPITIAFKNLESENDDSDDDFFFEDHQPNTLKLANKKKRVAISSTIKGFNEVKMILSQPARIPIALRPLSIDLLPDQLNLKFNSVDEICSSTKYVHNPISNSSVEAKRKPPPPATLQPPEPTEAVNKSSSKLKAATTDASKSSTVTTSETVAQIDLSSEEQPPPATLQPPEPTETVNKNVGKLNVASTTADTCKSSTTSETGGQIVLSVEEHTQPMSSSDAEFNRVSFRRIVQNRIEKSADGTEKVCQRIMLCHVKSAEYLQRRKEAKNVGARKKTSQCSECGKTMSSSQLRMHIQQHTGNKRYGCDICGKFFTRKAHVVFHMLIHMNVKPITCEVCGVSFRKVSNMTTHKQTVHLNVYRFACEVCNRKFKRKSDLLVHMNTHTGAKPFKCGQCEKEYTTPSAVRKHKRKFHA